MKIAITGGTGFVGRHLARELVARGHSVVLIARGQDQRDTSTMALARVDFLRSDLSGVQELTGCLRGCDAVAHLAGINREIGEQTYERVHVRGTANLIEAATAANVRKIVLLSFLRARPQLRFRLPRKQVAGRRTGSPIRARLHNPEVRDDLWSR